MNSRAHFGFFSRSAVLRNSCQGISGVGFVMNWIAAFFWKDKVTAGQILASLGR